MTTTQRSRWIAVAVSSCLALSGGVAGAADQPISAIKLILKIAASGKEKAVFVSKDPNFLFPPIGSNDDPGNGSPGGAIIDILTRDGGNATFNVPPGESPAPGWKVKDGVVDLYKYINKDAPSGPVAMKVVVLKDTKVIKFVGKETGVPLGGTLGDVVVRITTGTQRNCARFDAATIVQDEPGKFIAKGAVAGSLVDCASGPPTTSTSTTTSSSTSTSTSSTTSTSTSSTTTTSTSTSSTTTTSTSTSSTTTTSSSTTTTTSTSSTTTTAPPPSGTSLRFVTGVGAGDCGDVRAGGVGGTLLQNLDCGKLYLGAGDSTLAGGLTPSGSLTVFNSSCTSGTCTLSATTAGAVGANHCTSAATVTATACAGQAVNNATCVGAHGATSTCAADSFCHIPQCAFGTRLPIVNGPLSTCVTNTFRSNGGGSVSSGSGTGSMNIDLWSQPTVTGNLAAPCPLCSGAPGLGTCPAVAFNPGAVCTGTNATGNNYECVAGNVVTGSIPEFQVNLGAVSTSGASAAGPIFCPGQVTTGAFGWGGTGGNTTVADYIAVTGLAAGILTPGTHAVRAGSTFCIPATGNILVDGSTDLPGPGAVSLVGTWELLP